MDIAGIDSPFAAFSAGLVTSLHCAAMCGPLACWLQPVCPEDDGLTIQAAYQGTRLASYGTLGALVGAVGQAPLSWLGGSVIRYVPWGLVLFFLMVALRLDKKLPRIPLVARWSLRLHAGLKGRSRIGAAVILGSATPLMPCGPLYFVLALAAFTGSPLRGAEFMLAFGLGTLPLLWIVQLNFGWLRARMSPAWMARVQLGLALVAAIVLSWRLRGTLGFSGPGFGNWICF